MLEMEKTKVWVENWDRSAFGKNDCTHKAVLKINVWGSIEIKRWEQSIRLVGLWYYKNQLDEL